MSSQKRHGRNSRQPRQSDRRMGRKNRSAEIMVSLNHGGRVSRSPINPGHLNWRKFSGAGAPNCIKAAKLADGSYLLGNTRGGGFVQATPEEIQAFIDGFNTQTTAKA